MNDFAHRFFMVEPSIVDDVKKVLAGEGDVTKRDLSLAKFLHDCLGWFDEHEGLNTITLKSAIKAEVDDGQINVSHDIDIDFSGANPDIDVQEYIAVNLPWPHLGNGEFELSRDGEWCQRFFDLPEYSNVEYLALLRGVSVIADACFEMGRNQ